MCRVVIYCPRPTGTPPNFASYRNLRTQPETKTASAVELLIQEKGLRYSRIDVGHGLLDFPRFLSLIEAQVLDGAWHLPAGVGRRKSCSVSL
jgi:hypothetical protein